jgi:hypothetical protein
MDTGKYPDRLTCGVNQYMNAATYVFTKYADYLKARMERRIERQQETLSGALNNFQSWITR